MASTGATAWAKYFQGRDVETSMKKSSDAFDAATEQKLNFKIDINERVLVYDTDSFSSKIVVKRLKDDKNYKVTFNNIQKPGRQSAVNLKPQKFGIGETKYNIEDFVDLVLTSIEERQDLKPELKTYLEALILYFTNFESLSYLESAYLSSLPFNEIKKDFGEILGPIAIIKQGLLGSNGISIPNNKITKIYMPSRPNEPLMDYSIIDRKKTYIISAKSGTTTNVVKPKDIIDLLKKSPTKLRAYQNTQQYKILNKLADNGIVDGAILAASELPGGPSPEAAEDVKNKLRSGSYQDNKYSMELMSPFINSNAYLSRQTKPTLNQIMYECEKMVVAKSKNGLDFTPIFKSAVENQVIYVKFEMTGKTPKFEVIMNDDFSARKVTLRTKNGYNRRSDRIGIQV
jgi:hypothetical protein|tara:strand:- start:56 stop:1258 length:1203 start_codon:yes stop_codon:yes gene_type:complete